MTTDNDDPIDHLLQDHERMNSDRARQERLWLSVRRDSAARLLDAALGVLNATQHLLAVSEEVLKEQRDRLAEPAEQPGQAEENGAGRSGRRRIDLTY